MEMSDNGQLAQTGLGGAVVIGGTVYTGWWLLGAAIVVVGVGALLVRYGFRRKQSVNEA
jgi:hypothetical protein